MGFISIDITKSTKVCKKKKKKTWLNFRLSALLLQVIYRKLKDSSQESVEYLFAKFKGV